MSLREYRHKRHFAETPEPTGGRRISRYAQFEGIIPEKEYGGGTVMVWDIGTWVPEGEAVDAALEKGDLKFTLEGKKLKGSWVLVRLRPTEAGC